MRIRSLKPEFFKDGVTGRWDAELKMFYCGLWVFADDHGRFEWEPDLLGAELYPYDRGVNVPALLEKLRVSGRVLQYSFEGKLYGVILKFLDHQHPDKPKPSKFPDPSSGSICQGLVPDSSPTRPRRVTAGREGKGEEWERSGDASGTVSPPPAFKTAQLELVAAFEAERRTKYRWQGAKDSTALKSLLAGWPLPDIVARWRSALQATGWHSCSTVAQLAVKWNDLAPKVSPHDAVFLRLRDEADHEPPGPDLGNESRRGTPASLPSAPGALPASRASLEAAAGKLLGAGRSPGSVQDGARLEPRPERSADGPTLSLREPRDDVG